MVVSNMINEIILSSLTIQYILDKTINLNRKNSGEYQINQKVPVKKCL